MYKILAVDASTTNVGWCIGHGSRYVDSGQYRIKESFFDAVLAYERFLAEKLASERPDVVGYERPSGAHGNMKTNALLGALWYETWKITKNNGINIVVVSPLEVKRTGVHKNISDVVMPLVLENVTGCTSWPVTFKSKSERYRFGDQLDAIGIWLAVNKKIKGA